jgi:hypothetical protein
MSHRCLEFLSSFAGLEHFLDHDRGGIRFARPAFREDCNGLRHGLNWQAQVLQEVERGVSVHPRHGTSPMHGA